MIYMLKKIWYISLRDFHATQDHGKVTVQYMCEYW